jgi:putative glutamine amidotransferase
MKPIIGLFAEVDAEKKNGMKHSYSAAIELAGGIPVLLPYTENEETCLDYITLCDGFVFTGGADIDPKHYGEEIKPTCGKIFENRDRFELSAFPLVLNSGKPILGICRGFQLINVALGGTLYQDLPTEYKVTLPHQQTAPVTEPSHGIEILKGTPLYALIGKARMTGNSFHHQAIKALGKDLTVTARSEDGVIEAVFMPEKKHVRAYQWHPERLWQIDADNLAIFMQFVDACRNEG